MGENEKRTYGESGSLKLEIFSKVNGYGPLNEMDSWKKAYPEIDFIEENDGSFDTDVVIDWEKRTLQERAFYVMYMIDPWSLRVECEMEIEDENIKKDINDAEVIWRMWKDGCFSGDDLDDKAIVTMLWFMSDNEEMRREIVDMDLEEVMVLRLETLVEKK